MNLVEEPAWKHKVQLQSNSYSFHLVNSLSFILRRTFKEAWVIE